MRVAWSRFARADLHRIWMFVAERDAAFADRIEARLIEEGNGLGAFPGSGRPVTNLAIRRLSVTGIQYVIDYEIADDTLRILRVRSTRENIEP